VYAHTHGQTDRQQEATGRRLLWQPLRQLRLVLVLVPLMGLGAGRVRAHTHLRLVSSPVSSSKARMFSKAPVAARFASRPPPPPVCLRFAYSSMNIIIFRVSEALPGLKLEWMRDDYWQGASRDICVLLFHQRLSCSPKTQDIIITRAPGRRGRASYWGQPTRRATTGEAAWTPT
jgi:hypothetical protein